MRAAQSCALNRLVKASSKVEVDVNAAEKLMIGDMMMIMMMMMMMTCAEWDDFMHAYDNDIKPGFGAADEKLDAFLSRGIINWGDPVQVQWGVMRTQSYL